MDCNHATDRFTTHADQPSLQGLTNRIFRPTAFSLSIDLLRHAPFPIHPPLNKLVIAVLTRQENHLIANQTDNENDHRMKPEITVANRGEVLLHNFLPLAMGLICQRTRFVSKLLSRYGVLLFPDALHLATVYWSKIIGVLFDQNQRLYIVTKRVASLKSSKLTKF